ncbi:ADP-ribosylation factor 6-like [Gigantopelta aegis]|uniref:ADP-ribosylation factor 6-like n=1 Tax=Gigantopelta aegis TaxID=1735272 RepID=UPI001B889270|nr:ADP-ribosylation factor 6-like [Gigantopelta aegis]
MGQCYGSQGGKFPLNDGSSPIKIIITGPSLAGKSYLMYSWVLGVKNIIAIKPTDLFNVEHVTSGTGKKFIVYDLSGAPNMRPRQRPFYEATQGIVLVVNCADKASIDEAKKDLDQLLGTVELSGVPMLVAANRVDSPDAVSCDDIKSKLDLESKLSSRKWKICNLTEGSQEDVDDVLRELDMLVQHQKQ